MALALVGLLASGYSAARWGRTVCPRAVFMSDTVPEPVEAVAPPPPPPSKNSASIPFLLKQPKLDGTMAGDVGFDPFGFSNIEGEYINLKWMREAEIKHGRIAMLATAGWLAVDFGIKFPGAKYEGLTSLNAHGPMVESKNMALLFILVAAVEAYCAQKLFDDFDAHKPGDYGFDPLKMGQGKDMELKEIKNGRLAMLAFSGIVTQAALTGKGFPYF